MPVYSPFEGKCRRAHFRYFLSGQVKCVLACLLGLLCVLLLAAIIGLGIRTSENTHQMQTRYNNLTTEVEQLQSRFNDLSSQKSQLQKRLNSAENNLQKLQACEY